MAPERLPSPGAPELPVLVWGTYDLGKPRVRILLRAARERGIKLHEIHIDVWKGVEDKSRIDTLRHRTRYLLRWLGAYPVLLYRYLTAPGHDVVFVPYMGHLDVILLWPFARLRRARIVWDALISLHGTLVEDRALVASGSLSARMLKIWDRLALHCADQLITGTRARGSLYCREYGVDEGRITAIPVATELERFSAVVQSLPNAAFRARPQILFYGQFSPLHGLPVVLTAAASEAGRQWDWLFVGTGQEGWRIKQWIATESPPHVQWLDWVPYDELRGLICRADLCLGTFGASQKAATGVSNKVFQILACGRPLVTADTPAVREWLAPDMLGIYLVPAGDADALVQVLTELRQQVEALRGGVFHQELIEQLAPARLGEQLSGVFTRAVNTDQPREVTDP